MKTPNSLHAFLRIVKTIKRYCYKTADYRDPAENESINAYLNQQLMSQDWIVWQNLKAGERAALVRNQDALPDNTSSLRRFRLRVQEYRQEGFAYYQFWQQAQTTISAEVE